MADDTSELAGGECSYWACMPSKALLRPAQVVAEAGAVGGVTGARLDPAPVLARRNRHLGGHTRRPGGRAPGVFTRFG